ncbi:MAG: hypothetical protein ACM3SW_20925 [Actinomycetota bacterium]
MAAFTQPLTEKLAAFVKAIGLEVRPASLDTPTFLPGLAISHGAILIDEEKLLYPGDILHEAGHLAVAAPDCRKEMCGNAGEDGGEEMAAIAWSYAAAVYLDLEPAVVFHGNGYRGGSSTIVEQFAERRYIGVPVLEWLGMTADVKTAAGLKVPPYPHMLKWLRDS